MGKEISMSFTGIGFMEPGYTSKFGSESLQQKYEFSGQNTNEVKKDTFKRHKKPSVGAIAAGTAGIALLIYGIKTGKVNLKSTGKGLLGGLKGVADGIWKGIYAVGGAAKKAGSVALKAVKAPFKAISKIFSRPKP